MITRKGLANIYFLAEECEMYEKTYDEWATISFDSQDTYEKVIHFLSDSNLLQSNGIHIFNLTKLLQKKDDDVASAVKMLKERIQKVTVYAGTDNKGLYKPDVEKLIDECFPI